MKSSVESGGSIVLRQKEGLKEGTVWASKSLCLEFLPTVSLQIWRAVGSIAGVVVCRLEYL